MMRMWTRRLQFSQLKLDDDFSREEIDKSWSDRKIKQSGEILSCGIIPPASALPTDAGPILHTGCHQPV